MKALGYLRNGGDSSTFNCGYGRGYSVLEVLDAVDRATNQKIVRKLAPRRAGDPDSLISDNQRIKATLPWVPQYADLDTIYVQFVSDDPAFGGDLSTWTGSFADYAEAFFASRIIHKLTSDKQKLLMLLVIRKTFEMLWLHLNNWQ